MSQALIADLRRRLAGARQQRAQLTGELDRLALCNVAMAAKLRGKLREAEADIGRLEAALAAAERG